MGRKFQFNKLVRDNILESMLKNPEQNPEWKKLNDQEFIEELKKKLLEEVHELIKLDEIDPEEIADIQEVLNYIISTSKHSKEEINRIISKKREEIGGFDKKAYIGIQEVDENSDWINKYLEQPDKYPEIK